MARGETRRLAQEVVGAVREIMGGRPPATYYFAAVLLLYPDVDGSKAMRVGPVPAGQVYLGQK
jgi:hypothetical protein